MGFRSFGFPWDGLAMGRLGRGVLVGWNVPKLLEWAILQDRCLWMRLLLGCPVLKSFVSVEAPSRKCSLRRVGTTKEHAGLRLGSDPQPQCMRMRRALPQAPKAGGMVTLGETPYYGDTFQAGGRGHILTI